MKYIQNNLIFDVDNHHAIFSGIQKNYKKARLDIPAFIKGVPVTEINEDACNSNDDIERVLLPHTIVKIGDGAFWRCKKLEIVQLLGSLDNQPELIIGRYAFANCEKLVSFHAKTEIKIKNDAFANSSRLGLLDGYIKEVGARAFNNTPLDIIILAQNANVIENGLYGSQIRDIICVRDATFHQSAENIIQSKNINIHCPKTSNVIDLAYCGVNIETN